MYSLSSGDIPSAGEQANMQDDRLAKKRMLASKPLWLTFDHLREYVASRNVDKRPEDTTEAEAFSREMGRGATRSLHSDD